MAISSRYLQQTTLKLWFRYKPFRRNLKEAVIDRKASSNPELKSGDVVTIFSIKDIPVSLNKRTQFVRLGGEVQRPGVYQIEPGETLLGSQPVACLAN